MEQVPAPPRSYVVRGRSRAGGAAEVDAGSQTIGIDTSWGQPPSGLPGPAQLLASSFAACLLKNVERSGRLLGFHYETAEVEVSARRQDAPPRFVEVRYELRLVTDEPERRVELLHRNLREHGTVYGTLAAVCDVDGRIVVTAPSARPAR